MCGCRPVYSVTAAQLRKKFVAFGAPRLLDRQFVALCPFGYVGALCISLYAEPTAELFDEDFTEDAIDIVSLLHKSGLANTRSEGRRAVEQGGVTADGEKITDPKATLAKEKFEGDGIIVKKGKKNFRKVVLK